MKPMFAIASIMLLASIAAGQATAPATKPAVIKLEALFSSIPANLKYKEGESPKVQVDRDAWLMKAAEGKQIEVSMTVGSMTLRRGVLSITGTSQGLPVSASFQADAKLSEREAIVFRGTLRTVRSSPANRLISFTDCAKVNR